MGLSYQDRVLGMLYGSALGDAIGGPWEFLAPKLGAYWKQEETLDAHKIQQLAAQLKLSPYHKSAEPYGVWLDQAPAGTTSDDTRFKAILLQVMKQGRLTGEGIASAILSYQHQEEELSQKWLNEFREAAKWKLGTGGLPPDRMWGGVESLMGQMIFLPIAALYPGKPEKAYLKTWELNIFDTGIAKDLNAVVIAGLAVALGGGDWSDVLKQMRQTDPYRFGEAVYGKRSLDNWLDVADEIVYWAKGRPKFLFDLLEERLEAVMWWEAWVPLVVMYSCYEMCERHPLAAMQLALEFGHDTDSYLQLMGAFMGAMYGVEIFPSKMRETLSMQFLKEYDQSLEEWAEILIKKLTL